MFAMVAAGACTPAFAKGWYMVDAQTFTCVSAARISAKTDSPQYKTPQRFRYYLRSQYGDAYKGTEVIKLRHGLGSLVVIKFTGGPALYSTTFRGCEVGLSHLASFSPIIKAMQQGFAEQQEKAAQEKAARQAAAKAAEEKAAARAAKVNQQNALHAAIAAEEKANEQAGAQQTAAENAAASPGVNEILKQQIRKERAELNQTFLEAKAPAAAEPTEASQQRMLGELINTIKTLVSEHWIPVSNSHTSCEIQIHLGPQGQLLGTPAVIRSSGVTHFDHLVVAAVEASAPFVPPPGLPYSAFDVPIDLKMNAEDLNNG